MSSMQTSDSEGGEKAERKPGERERMGRRKRMAEADCGKG